MATETLPVQYGGGSGADTHELPVDFFDPNQRLRRHNSMVTGALGSFGMRKFDLRPFDPDRDNIAATFVDTEQSLGDLALAKVVYDEAAPIQN